MTLEEAGSVTGISVDNLKNRDLHRISPMLARSGNRGHSVSVRGDVAGRASPPVSGIGGSRPRQPSGTSRNATKETSPTRVTKVAPA